jgi:hypothetical protein
VQLISKLDSAGRGADDQHAALPQLARVAVARRVREVIPSGTSRASAGTAGTVAAPQASTTVGARQLPWSVRTM